MAMFEFVQNVRTARNVAAFNAAVSPAHDLARLKRAREIWMSPRVVAGYDPADFAFLPADKQHALAAAVDGYRSAVGASADREPTDDETRRALGHLLAIAGALEGELLDTEGPGLLKAAWEANAGNPFPDFVLGMDYTLDTDWSGDPGFWVWVIVPDDLDPDSDEFHDFSARFRKTLWPTLTRAKSERIPYTGFRLLSGVVNGVPSEDAA